MKLPEKLKHLMRETFLLQAFHQDVLNHREPIALLDKQRGEQKFTGQKQDMVLMRNLTTNLLKRWEKVHSKILERAYQIDVGLKEAKMFSDGWKVSRIKRLFLSVLALNFVLCTSVKVLKKLQPLIASTCCRNPSQATAECYKAPSALVTAILIVPLKLAMLIVGEIKIISKSLFL